MKVPENLKAILKSVTGNGKDQKPIIKQEPGSDDVHYTPPGQWPTTGPKPSKLGVLFYYISLMFCIIGILSMAKCQYARHEDRPEILMVGSILVLVGFLFLSISNFIYNREQRRLVNYLKGKIEELMEENQGKGPRALDS